FAPDDLRPRPGRFLVHAVTRLLVLGHAELFHAAVRRRVLAAQLHRADQPLAGLIAGRAVGELRVGDALMNLEAAVAAVAVARGGSVVVKRHQPWALFLPGLLGKTGAAWRDGDDG